MKGVRNQYTKWINNSLNWETGPRLRGGDTGGTGLNKIMHKKSETPSVPLFYIIHSILHPYQGKIFGNIDS